MGKVILITGVSSGFGKATAELLAHKGHTIYGTIRSESKLDPLVNILRMDLTNVESIKEAVQFVLKKEGRIDVLINNAGMHSGGPIEETPVELFVQQMNTNFNGTVHLIQDVLPSMRQQKQGTIINISSIGGLMGLPFQGFYSASKFAIEGLSEALRMELKPFNVSVVVVNPGDFCTSNTSNRINIVSKNGPYAAQFEKSLAQIQKDETGGWDPQILARKMMNIVESDSPSKRYIIGSYEQKFAVFLKRILPITLFDAILSDHYKMK
jgi:NAD(P)-dependent dehydrogenase (short-subunit alcohol dehydrogenase family)